MLGEKEARCKQQQQEEAAAADAAAEYVAGMPSPDPADNYGCVFKQLHGNTDCGLKWHIRPDLNSPTAQCAKVDDAAAADAAPAAGQQRSQPSSASLAAAVTTLDEAGYAEGGQQQQQQEGQQQQANSNLPEHAGYVMPSMSAQQATGSGDARTISNREPLPASMVDSPGSGSWQGGCGKQPSMPGEEEATRRKQQQQEEAAAAAAAAEFVAAKFAADMLLPDDADGWARIS
jgi:hypothetical protein